MARITAKKSGKQMKTSMGKKKTASTKAERLGKQAMAKFNMDTSTDNNHKALWRTYHELKERVDQALEQLRMHFEEGAAPFVLLQDEKQLLLLLGECNYMAHTFMDLNAAEQRRR
jgi:hypothetical protein